jgi:hypothetical protein
MQCKQHPVNMQAIPAAVRKLLAVSSSPNSADSLCAQFERNSGAEGSAKFRSGGDGGEAEQAS